MTVNKKILVVDDDAFNRTMVQKLLAGTYEIIEAENGKAALETLAQHYTELAAIVLDLVMPVMDGYEFLRIYSKMERYRNLPVLVLTSESKNNVEARCLELGAWDFIRKPFNSLTLKLRLKNIISRSLLSSLEQLQHMADHDSLTGLYNRAKFFFQTRLMLDANPEEEFMLIRFDIERFHLINALFGEDEGNSILKFVARSIKRFVEGAQLCTYGRIESDVFCFCAPTKLIDLERVVKRAKKLFSGYNYDYYIEPSFGVYTIHDSSLSVETMYERASMAAEKCKNKYMTYVEFYDDGMSEAALNEQQIINEMQTALDSGQFVVYLQPKYSLSTNLPFGTEALVRWQHPERGIVSPNEFIPVFERNGFIGKLDYYMWEQSCKLLRKWSDEGLNLLPISVNVSRANMYNPHLVEMLTELLAKYELSPGLLNLEITESSYMDNPHQMKKTISELQSRGFIILMDDFGSGYSSLNTLKDIDVDILKIDMKFLPTGEGDSRSERILASVIRLADRLDLPVIVEGVETQEQKEFLMSIGCDYAQGYLFAKPMPVPEFEKLLGSTDFEQHMVGKPSQKAGALDFVWSASPHAETIFMNIMQPIAVYEYSHGVCEPLRFNKAFIELFGFEPAIENSLRIGSRHISDEDRAKLAASFEQAVARKGEMENEYRWVTESGSEMWIRVKLQYVSSDHERSVLFAVFTDITELKRLECELNALRLIAPKADPKRATVLIVDDSVVSRSIAKAALQERYSVLEAENGAQALSYLKIYGTDISAILLDIVMPVMDGETFLKHKNADPGVSGVPVIVFSSEEKKSIRAKAMKLGAVDFITKPCAPEILLTRLQDVIGAFSEVKSKVLRRSSAKKT